MSDRERWIIYPLLFFALMLAAKDQITLVKPTTDAPQNLVCGRLIANTIDCLGSVKSRAFEAIDSDGRLLVKISDDVTDGRIAEFYSQGGEPLVAIGTDQTGQAGVIETKHGSRVVMVRLTANEFGGVVEALHRDGHLLVQLAGSDQGGKVATHPTDALQESSGEKNVTAESTKVPVTPQD